MQSFPKKLENETIGPASDAEHALLLALQTYTAATTSAGLTKQHATILRTVTQFVPSVTWNGMPISMVIISFLNSNSSAKPTTKRLSVAHVRSSSSARGSK